jgi:hypothetical protein
LSFFSLIFQASWTIISSVDHSKSLNFFTDLTSAAVSCRNQSSQVYLYFRLLFRNVCYTARLISNIYLSFGTHKPVTCKIYSFQLDILFVGNPSSMVETKFFPEEFQLFVKKIKSKLFFSSLHPLIHQLMAQKLNFCRWCRVEWNHMISLKRYRSDYSYSSISIQLHISTNMRAPSTEAVISDYKKCNWSNRLCAKLLFVS